MLSERRRTSLLEFAHKIEKEYFLSSDSRHEYFNLIAKKIRHIRVEFEEKKLLRKIDHLNSSMHRRSISATPHPPSGPTAGRSANATESRSIWIQTLSVEFRQQIVKKILHVICPVQRAAYDLRLLRLIKCAHKMACEMESDCYLRATSKETYFQLIAEKVQRILTELSYKRARRQEHKVGRSSESDPHRTQTTTVRLNGGMRFDGNHQLSNELESSRNQTLPKTGDSVLIKSSNLSSIKRIFESPIESSGNQW